MATRVLTAAKQESRPYIIAVDFDKTICDGGWPDTSKGRLRLSTVTRMAQVLKERPNTEFILWTCRHGKSLQDAITFVRKHKLPIEIFNEQHPHTLNRIKGSGDWRKILADEYWDDKAVRI